MAAVNDVAGASQRRDPGLDELESLGDVDQAARVAAERRAAAQIA